MSKRYYWLKLNQNFFDSSEIKVLKKMENGSDYIVFWQELLLSSLSYTEETQKIGLLAFKENIPWNQDLMENVFGHSREIITGAMAMFKKLGMITVSESGEIWANDIEKLIGRESDSAERVRRHRAKIKELERLKITDNTDNKKCNVTCNDKIVTGNKSCNTEKEIELEKDLEIDVEKEKELKIKIAPAVTMTKKQYQKLKDDFGEDVTQLAIDKLSNFKMSKDKKYKSDYHAVLNWVIEEVTGKDNETVKAEKKGKDEEVERKRKYDDDLKQGKLKKLPLEMTHGLIEGALKKSEFLHKKDSIDSDINSEEQPWGFEK